MALTDFSSVYVDIHETGFNNILRHFQLQRPSLFNYGTADMLKNPRLFCVPISFHPAVAQYSNPVATGIPYVPIPGYFGPHGLSACMQIVSAGLDFHPENSISPLPEELQPLAAQETSLTATLSIGLGCPGGSILEQFVPAPGNEPDLGKLFDDIPSPTQPFPSQKMICFRLEVYAKVRIVRNPPVMEMRLLNLEIVDISPNGMEKAIECYAITLVKLALIPQVRIMMEDLVFELNDFISLAPAPISADIPFNPSVANDRVAIFYNLL